MSETLLETTTNLNNKEKVNTLQQFAKKVPHAKMLDSLSDGQWHVVTKVIRRNLRYFVKEYASEGENILRAALNDLVDQNVLLVGENNSYRFLLPHLEDWRTMRGLNFSNQGKLHVPRYFGGILEDDGWLLAPLRVFDLVHFRAGGEISVSMIQDHIGLAGVVSQDEDGLIRISTLNGQGIYNSIKKWKEDEDLDISGVRADTGVRRRELSDLPARYVEDMCVFYGSFAHTLLRKDMSSVRKHITEREDVQQRIFMWVIDAIQRYDDSTSIPFAAYLSTALQRWVHDLNRKSYGRAAADNELKYARAISSFESENGRKPTTLELSKVLNEDIATTRERSASIAVVKNLRSMSTLDSLDYEIPLPASDNHAEDLDEEVNQTLMSAAFTAAVSEQNNNYIGWVALYEQIWGSGQVPSAKSLGITPKVFGLAQKQLRTDLAERLTHLREA